MSQGDEDINDCKMMENGSIQQIANCSTLRYHPPSAPAPVAATLSILVAASLYLVFHSIWSKRSRRGDTIVLAGLSGSGKTVIFRQLRDGVFNDRSTIPTSEPCEESFVLHSETTWKGRSKPVKVVDLPGNCKIDDVNKYLDRAAGVVYVVDALGFVWNYLSVSEYLHEILINTTMIKRKIPLLILCNKIDQQTAHTTGFIITQLHKEIKKLNPSLEGKVLSGERRRKVPFPFSSCKVAVSIAEGSGLTGDIYQLETFIRKHAKKGYTMTT